MSEDLTKKLLHTDSETLTLILTTVQSLTVRVDNIDLRFSRVEQTVDDTRSILQNVVGDIVQLQEGQRALSTEVRGDILKLQEGQRALSTEVRADILQLQEGQKALGTEVRALRRDMDNRFSVMYGMLGEIQMDGRNIHDRVTRLELNTNPPNSQT